MFSFIVLTAIGFFGAAVLAVLAFGIAAPLYIPTGLFTNKPTKESRSGFHLFTFIEPGQMKIVVRGERIVRAIMDTDGVVFDRNGSKQSAEYWETKTVQAGAEDPTADIVWFLRPWARYVFNTTGAVFTGLYPFQRVREYPLERTLISRSEENDSGAGTAIEKTNIVLKVENDYSDHYRQRTFLYPMHIKGAETKDKIPLDILGVAEMHVTNPYKAAFGTDRWDHHVVNLVTNKLNETTKTMTLDKALTSSSKVGAGKIAKSVTEIVSDTDTCGIEITNFRVLEINPVLTVEGLALIQAEALATQQAKATRIDGSARADALRAINEANVAGGEHSIAAMQSENFVRAAEAIGKSGGTAILMPQSGQNSTDPTQAAILAQLIKANEGK